MTHPRGAPLAALPARLKAHSAPTGRTSGITVRAGARYAFAIRKRASTPAVVEALVGSTGHGRDGWQRGGPG